MNRQHRPLRSWTGAEPHVLERCRNAGSFVRWIRASNCCWNKPFIAVEDVRIDEAPLFLKQPVRRTFCSILRETPHSRGNLATCVSLPGSHPRHEPHRSPVAGILGVLIDDPRDVLPAEVERRRPRRRCTSAGLHPARPARTNPRGAVPVSECRCSNPIMSANLGATSPETLSCLGMCRFSSSHSMKSFIHYVWRRGVDFSEVGDPTTATIFGGGIFCDAAFAEVFQHPWRTKPKENYNFVT